MSIRIVATNLAVPPQVETSLELARQHPRHGLHGTISQRVGLMTGSGGVSTDEFGREFDQAVSDPDVGAILMDVDSPGGSVFGVHELSQRGLRPQPGWAVSGQLSAIRE